MVPIKFQFKDIIDLNEDLKQSPKALQVIVRTVLSRHLRKLRDSLKSRAPTRAQRNLAFSVRKSKSIEYATWAILGFLRSKRTSAQSAIIANVFQKGFAETGARGRYGHRSAENIWIPLPAAGLNLTPSQFLAMPGTFIRRSHAGNKIAFQRSESGTLWPMFVLKQRINPPSSPPIDFEGEVLADLPETLGDIQQTIAEVLEARGAVIRQAQNGGQ